MRNKKEKDRGLRQTRPATRRQTYTILYSRALILNLFTDITLQAYPSYLQMLGIGAHTAGGKLLKDLSGGQRLP